MHTALRLAIRAAHRRDEAACVAALCQSLAASPYDRLAAAQQAQRWVETVREQHRRHPGGVDELMHEFSLSSQEGVALMCLAEALLRIPDRATVDKLIRDKLGHGDWAAHVGGRRPLFLNAAAWGLLLTGRLLALPDEGALAGSLSRLLSKGSEPLIRRAMDYAMRLLGQRFVMGETIAAALERARLDEARGYRHSFDMLGEAALTGADAQRYFDAYCDAIAAIGAAAAGRGVVDGPGISIKLSALHPRYCRAQQDRVMTELLPRLKALAQLARQHDLGLNIDAEESERLELSLDLLAALAPDPDLAGWHGLGFVVQAYQKRCPAVIDYLIALARGSRRRLMVRLVKGAYWDSEIKRAQVAGLSDYPVYSRKCHTDLAYLVAAERLLAAPDAIYPQFASHNALTLASIEQLAKVRGVHDFEFQRLHGMGEALYDQAVRPGVRLCRIYAPVGSHRTLLPYLVRRLLENGANSSFVHRIVDESVAPADLVEDPALASAAHGGRGHPDIPLPPELFGPERRNAAGLDLDDDATWQALESVLHRLDAPRSHLWQACPLVPGAPQSTIAPQTRYNPADSKQALGQAVDADGAIVACALDNAEQASAAWHATEPEVRCCILLRAADLLEAERESVLYLCLREAGKTWPNAVGEWREAVDFCRYYAQQLAAGQVRLSVQPPGPALCISPWNFPLAIFIGQISAALAAGCPVLAKPAEQTPLMAYFAVDLLHRAGVPADVLQLLPGPGECVGAALAADSRVKTVVFTGSTAVARLIDGQLAVRPGTRLIAETGGQNAMIVDSSALLEQAVQDILTSAFDSAGQRCSALRVLCLQEDIADEALALIRAAMAEWCLGDPARRAADMGPVIDSAARDGLCQHIDRMRGLGRPVFQLPLPESAKHGSFVPPTLIELAAWSDLEGEVFGPVLHVLRFDGGRLERLIADINATGYGLTLGVHSRIDRSIAAVARLACVGNLYVNRNMIGAVVGVQPFGGEGLSGTGPKAGGPLYLPWLAGADQVAPAAVVSPVEPVAPPPLLNVLRTWAESCGHPDWAEMCRAAADLTLLPHHLLLPGPTGEQNRLSFAPRGKLLCVAETADGLLAQLAAALATGNQPVVADHPASLSLYARLPHELQAAISFGLAPSQWPQLAGALCQHRQGKAVRELLQHFTTLDGPLRPIFYAEDRPPHYPIYRLCLERVISINTTAAGGNAALMAQAG